MDPSLLFIAMAATVGLTFVFIFVAFYTLFSSKKSNDTGSMIQERVKRVREMPEELKDEVGTGAGPSGVIEDKGMLTNVDLAPMLGRLTGEAYFETLEEDLARADIPLRSSEYLILRFGIVIFVTLLAAVLLKNLLFGLLIGVPLIFVHGPMIGFLKSMRISKFVNQLGEFLVLIVNSLRAGQTFMQGCQVAVQEAPNPVAKEFRQVIKEVNLGMPEREAMENLLKRVPCEDVNIVVSAYLIQRKVGGNLAEILQTTADTIRERIKLQGKVDTLTTQGKLSGVIVGILPFLIAAGISSINPAYMSPMFGHWIGWCIIGGALTLQVIGCVAIMMIVSIDI